MYSLKSLDIGGEKTPVRERGLRKVRNLSIRFQDSSDGQGCYVMSFWLGHGFYQHPLILRLDETDGAEVLTVGTRSSTVPPVRYSQDRFDALVEPLAVHYVEALIALFHVTYGMDVVPEMMKKMVADAFRQRKGVRRSISGRRDSLLLFTVGKHADSSKAADARASDSSDAFLKTVSYESGSSMSP